MTLEESNIVLPVMEEMLLTLEEQQEMITQLYQELMTCNTQLEKYRRQVESLTGLNRELTLLTDGLPDLEKLAGELETVLLEKEKLEQTVRDWMQLAERLNSENNSLTEQNASLQKLLSSYEGGLR